MGRRGVGLLLGWALPLLLFVAALGAVSDPKLALAQTASVEKLPVEKTSVTLLGVEKPKADCSIATTAMEAVSGIRRLRVLTQVPCRLQSRDEVEIYLRDTIKRKISDQRIEMEGRVYKLLGLIPPDYDYLNGIVALYTDQLGGYYDPDLNYYAMADWMPPVMQMSIAVHELTHALQDQHFDLGKLIDNNRETSDTLMARSALAEGDATAVMLDFERERVGQPPLEVEGSIAGFMMENIVGAMGSSSVQKVPPALRHLLIFPYVGGLRFAHTLLQDGGYRRIDKAFRAPPVSTEQILHPEKYLAGDQSFKELSIGTLKGLGEPVYTDRLGEFVISALLGSYIAPFRASQAAAGWDGDRLALYASPTAKFGALSWVSEWESEADAREFFEALRDAYLSRFGGAIERSDDALSFDMKQLGRMSITRKKLGVRVEVR